MSNPAAPIILPDPKPVPLGYAAALTFTSGRAFPVFSYAPPPAIMLVPEVKP